MSLRPILLVEDDAAIRELLCTLLEHRGYVVQCAASGAEALAMLRAGDAPPALIVLDLVMPTMDGYAFRAAQKQIPGAADIPVAVTSAIPDLRMDELEPAAVVMKPLELDDLLPIVERYCGPSSTSS
jgi:CheY-like chemotaxis protein